MDSSNSYSRDCGWRWKHHGHRPLFIYLFIFLPEWCLSLQWCLHVCTNRVRVQWSPTVASSRPEMTSGMTPEMTSGMTSDPATVGSLLFVVEFLIKKSSLIRRTRAGMRGWWRRVWRRIQRQSRRKPRASLVHLWNQKIDIITGRT